MFRRLVQAYFAFMARIGADADDSEEVRLQKPIMMSASPALILAGAIWSVMYFAFGEPIAGIIPGSYAVLSVLSILLFAWHRGYAFFRFTQLILILLLPFLLQITLGGFINSSAVVLWSLICPIGALIFAGPRQTVRWFVLYLALVVVSGFLQAYVRTTNNLSASLVITLFVLNVSAISAIVFGLYSAEGNRGDSEKPGRNDCRSL